jgi:DNA (cytosine-5)-methyltransferase 1
MKMIGQDLREHRKRLGLSQAKLSELTGVSQHILSAIELEKVDPTQNIIDILRETLADEKKIYSVIHRKKRYQEHNYNGYAASPERISMVQQTVENIEYKKILSTLWARHNSNEKQHTAISIFSGCGGLSLGFSAAGFKILGFVELEEKLAKMYSCNFPNSTQLGMDIASVTDTSLEIFSSKIEKVDVIIGGPPCQGFSLAGKRDVNDPRNKLFKHYLRFINVFRPKVALLENVRLLTSMKDQSGKLIKDDIVDLFNVHGYKVKSFEINAKDYGVPQHRERVVFVAVRADLSIEPTIPHKTNVERRSLLASKYRTFADACSDLPFIESGQVAAEDKLHEAVSHPAHVIKWLWDVPQGASAHDNEDPENRPPSGYNTTYKRQIWNEPAATVQTTFGMISGCRNVHPIATRSLTIREAARIQSFPDEFYFLGTIGDIRKGIGNAVPPLLAYAFAEHIKKLL